MIKLALCRLWMRMSCYFPKIIEFNCFNSPVIYYACSIIFTWISLFSFTVRCWFKEFRPNIELLTQISSSTFAQVLLSTDIIDVRKLILKLAYKSKYWSNVAKTPNLQSRKANEQIYDNGFYWFIYFSVLRVQRQWWKVDKWFPQIYRSFNIFHSFIDYCDLHFRWVLVSLIYDIRYLLRIFFYTYKFFENKMHSLIQMYCTQVISLNWLKAFYCLHQIVIYKFEL